MIHYRIHRPFSDMCEGAYPKEAAWADVGLAHLLPLQVTGSEWPVRHFDGGFSIGRGIAPDHWTRISDVLEIGWVTPPGPKQLQRPKIIPGMEIPDSHGNQWIIPNANQQSPMCSLPRDLQWNMDGPALEIEDRYRALVEMCSDMFHTIVTADRIDHLQAAEQALQILQVNYRIGRPELIALQAAGIKIIDNNTATKIVLWFVDHDLLDDFVKKKQHGD